MTKAAKPHCDHANWRNHRPEDDIEVSGASHKPDCSVHYNDPKRLNCNCGLWEAAKPVRDAGLVDSIYALRGMDAGHALTIEERREAADTIEALVQDNERLAKALTYISWVGPALVAPGGVLWIRQDSVDALLLDAGIMPHRPLTGESEDDYYRRVRGEGDQLQGGENLSERFERLAADPGLEERSRRVRDGIREASKVNPYTADELAAINNQHPWGDCNDSNQSCRLLATALKLQRELTNIHLLCTEARAGSPHVYAMNSEKWLMNKILNLLGGSDK